MRIIGEAARGLPQEIRDQAQSVAWRDIIGMRHILVHQYFGVDLGVVWDIVRRDLPELKRHVEALLRELEATVV